RSRTRFLGRAAADLLPLRHRRGDRLGGGVLGGDGAARARRRAARHAAHVLGSRHPAVLPHRPGPLRPGPCRRVRRPDLPADATAAPVSHPSGAREGIDLGTQAVVFGYGDIGVRGLRTLLDAGVQVPLVVTHVDDPNETRWYASLLD